MGEQKSPEKAPTIKRAESESEGSSKSYAPPPFALNASQSEASSATPGADVGLGLDKRKEP